MNKHRINHRINHRIKHQSGFTLIELLVGLAILTILAVTVSGAFDGSRSRAQALVSAMSEIGGANIRLKNDTGCYIKRPDALTNGTTGKATTSNYCSKDLSSTWNGPYLSKFSSDASTGAVKLDNVSSTVLVSLEQESGGVGKHYYTHAINLPSDVVKQALQECNKDATEGLLTTDFDNKKCRGSSGATDGTGIFDMIYDETR